MGERGRVISAPSTNEGDNLVRSLSRTHQAALVRYFIRRGIHVDEAPDLAQEVFTKLSRQGFLDAIENPVAYLFAIAATVAVDHGRRTRLRSASAAVAREVVHPDDPLPPDRILAAREELTLILAALNEMPERMRHIFILARIENLPRLEIARRLGVSKSCVEQEIAHAAACLADRRQRFK